MVDGKKEFLLRSVVLLKILIEELAIYGDCCFMVFSDDVFAVNIEPIEFSGKNDLLFEFESL